MEPVVSVIMPVYNAGEYLEPAINSVLNQSFQDFELLLIDDGATDGSGNICEVYAAKDSRVKLFRQQNKGICGARNLGLEKANGKYIAFCDHDDTCLQNMLEDNVRLAEETSADIVRFKRKKIFIHKEQNVNWKIINCQNPLKTVWNPQLIKENYSKFIKDAGYGVWCGIYNRNFLLDSKITFDIAIKYGYEDHLFNIQCYGCARKAIINNAIYYIWWQRKLQSTSCAISDEIIINRINAICKIANQDYMYISRNALDCKAENAKRKLDDLYYAMEELSKIRNRNTRKKCWLQLYANKLLSTSLIGNQGIVLKEYLLEVLFKMKNPTLLCLIWRVYFNIKNAYHKI